MNGRLVDVLIEPTYLYDKSTGTKEENPDTFLVWADLGLEKAFQEIEGVHSIFRNGNQYYVSVDRRYDVDYIKNEIVAVVKCR